MQPRADVLIVHARMIIVVICVLLKFPNISSSCHLSSMDSCLVCRHSIVGESFRWSQHCLMMKAQRSLALLWRSALLACDVRHLLEKDCAGDLSYTTRMSQQGVSIIARWIIGRQTSFDSPNTSFESSTAWNGNFRFPKKKKGLISELTNCRIFVGELPAPDRYWGFRNLHGCPSSLSICSLYSLPWYLCVTGGGRRWIRISLWPIYFQFRENCLQSTDPLVAPFGYF